MTAAPGTLPATALLTTRPRGRLALAAVAPLAPLAMAAWALATPYDPADDVPAAAAAIAAHPTGAQVGVLMLVLAGTVGGVGALVVGAAVRPGSPRLGAVATAMTVVGFGVAAYPGPVPAVAAAPSAGLSIEPLLRLVEVVDGQLQATVTGVLFVCLPAGILLLGVAALLSARRGRFPLPAAAVLVASIPLVLAGGFVAAPALAAGWLVVAVGFAAAGARYAASPSVLPSGPGAPATASP